MGWWSSGGNGGGSSGGVEALGRFVGTNYEYSGTVSFPHTGNPTIGDSNRPFSTTLTNEGTGISYNATSGIFTLIPGIYVFNLYIETGDTGYDLQLYSYGYATAPGTGYWQTNAASVVGGNYVVDTAFIVSTDPPESELLWEFSAYQYSGVSKILQAFAVEITRIG